MSTQRSLAMRLVIPVAAWLLRRLGATWRITQHGQNPLDDPVRQKRAHIGAIWHRNVLLATWFFRDRSLGVSVSLSHDGDLITALLERMGYTQPARGSSSRGGRASLVSLLRSVRQGVSVAILADGPRGPARRSKPGIVVLSQLSGAEITPVAFAASRGIRFRSWDGTLLPLPFARVAVAFGEPIHVPNEVDAAGEEALCQRLDDVLNAMTDTWDEAIRTKAQPGPG